MSHNRDLMAMDAVYKAIQEIGENIPPQRVQILLELARRPNMTSKELCEAIGVAQASISRNLDALGEEDRHGNPGLGLVETERDPNETRRRIARLTPKGWEVVNRLLAPIAALKE